MAFDFLKATPGDRLVFTYIRIDFIDSRTLYGQEVAYQKVVNEPIWLFGLDPAGVANFLRESGCRLVKHAG